MKRKYRCRWAQASELEIKYHDKEWGVPIHNDRKLFESLTLEGAQAGLSWSTILKKRANYRKAFLNFDPKKVAKFSKRDINRLMKDEGIVRNELKIGSTINNAKRILEIKEEFGSFSKYIWQFVDEAPVKNSWRSLKQIPSKTEESTLMSKELKKRGFRFVGPTTCYAFMQAVGMVNDHETRCFRYKEV